MEYSPIVSQCWRGRWCSIAEEGDAIGLGLLVVRSSVRIWYGMVQYGGVVVCRSALLCSRFLFALTSQLPTNGTTRHTPNALDQSPTLEHSCGMSITLPQPYCVGYSFFGETHHNAPVVALIVIMRWHLTRFESSDHSCSLNQFDHAQTEVRADCTKWLVLLDDIGIDILVPTVEFFFG